MKRLVVVGAGISGLAAAHAAAERLGERASRRAGDGVEIVVLERAACGRRQGADHSRRRLDGRDRTHRVPAARPRDRAAGAGSPASSATCCPATALRRIDSWCGAGGCARCRRILCASLTVGDPRAARDPALAARALGTRASGRRRRERLGFRAPPAGIAGRRSTGGADGARRVRRRRQAAVAAGGVSTAGRARGRARIAGARDDRDSAVGLRARAPASARWRWRRAPRTDRQARVGGSRRSRTESRRCRALWLRDPARVRCGAAVESMERGADGRALGAIALASRCVPTRVVLACEAGPAAAHGADLAPGLSSVLGQIAYPPVAVVALGFDAAAAARRAARLRRVGSAR